eukprot:6194208-Amphidinium_carterae.1
MDWPDPFKPGAVPGAAGVAATVRVQNPLDVTLATVVARSVAVVGQVKTHQRTKRNNPPPHQKHEKRENKEKEKTIENNLSSFR